MALATLTTSITPADGSELDDARVRATEAASALAAAETELATLEVSIKDLQTRIGSITAQFADLENDVSALAVNRYVRLSGGVGTSDLGYTSPSSADLNLVLRADALVRAAAGYEKDSLDQLIAARADLADSQQMLASQLSSQSEIKAQLAARRDEVFTELATLEEAEAKRRAEQERQERAAAARRAAANDTSGRTVAAAAGSWLCPVAGSTAFSDTWGAPRSGGRRHKGVDMMAAHGTPVVASVSGSVRHTQNRLGGLAYYLKGDDGNTYYGAHLSRFGTSGQVAAGAVVGYIGDTGNARGIDHLHFEIKAGGTRTVNPTPTVARNC